MSIDVRLWRLKTVLALKKLARDCSLVLHLLKYKLSESSKSFEHHNQSHVLMSTIWSRYYNQDNHG